MSIPWILWRKQASGRIERACETRTRKLVLWNCCCGPEGIETGSTRRGIQTSPFRWSWSRKIGIRRLQKACWNWNIPRRCMENMFRFEFRILFQLVTEKRLRTHEGLDSGSSYLWGRSKRDPLRTAGPGPGWVPEFLIPRIPSSTPREPRPGPAGEFPAENMDSSVRSFLLSLQGGTNQGKFFSVISQTPGDLGQMIPRTHVFHLSERADESLPLAMRPHSVTGNQVSKYWI
jgi:hypothetical protein